MTEHDPARRSADDPRPIDERALLHRQGLAPDDPGGGCPARGPDDDDDHHERDPDPEHLATGTDDVEQDRREDEREDERREDQEEVGDTHEERVHRAAEVAGDDPDERAESDRYHGRK